MTLWSIFPKNIVTFWKISADEISGESQVSDIHIISGLWTLMKAPKVAFLLTRLKIAIVRV